MFHLILGALAAAGLAVLFIYSRQRGITAAWWGWALTALAVVYAVFVVEVIVGFLQENVARGALIMGLILGIPAIIWGALLGRFVFRAPTPPAG